MFSFWTAGTRFIDLCYLKWKNIIDNRLIYTMSKTREKSDIKLFPDALQILSYYEPTEPDKDRFIFPLLPQGIEEEDIKIQKKKIAAKNALTNKYLKRIQKLAEITTNVSMHIARHSFADYWRKSGGSIHSLKSLLRHSSISITERYIKSFDVETVDAEMDAMYSKIKPDKEKTLKIVK